MKLSKKLASIGLAVAMVASMGVNAFAATTGVIQSHEIPANATIAYYNDNGYSIAKNNYIILDATLDNQYTWASYLINVTTNGASNYKTLTSSNVYNSAQAGTTALYKVALQNKTTVPMRVQSGTIKY